MVMYSLEIDIEIAKAQSNENPVFYVQYAYARINSIFEKAREAGAFTGEAPAIPDSIDFSLYNEDEYWLKLRTMNGIEFIGRCSYQQYFWSAQAKSRRTLQIVSY